jgi:hypothetical protein
MERLLKIDTAVGVYLAISILQGGGASWDPPHTLDLTKEVVKILCSIR